eukprot:jgi/Chrpa1/2654/Chrysochromulina_OHIO_Genome00017835-RA
MVPGKSWPIRSESSDSRARTTRGCSPTFTRMRRWRVLRCDADAPSAELLPAGGDSDNGDATATSPPNDFIGSIELDFACDNRLPFGSGVAVVGAAAGTLAAPPVSSAAFLRAGFGGSAGADAGVDAAAATSSGAVVAIFVRGECCGATSTKTSRSTACVTAPSRSLKNTSKVCVFCD